MARSTTQAAKSASCSSTASSKSSPITKLLSFLCHATLPFASCMPGLSPTKRSSCKESRKERRPLGVPDFQVVEGPSTDGSPALTTNAADLHASNAWLDDCNPEVFERLGLSHQHQTISNMALGPESFSLSSRSSTRFSSSHLAANPIPLVSPSLSSLSPSSLSSPSSASSSPSKYPTDLLKPSVSVLSFQSSDLDDASDQTKAVRPSADAALPSRPDHMDDQVRAANVISSDLSEPRHPKTTATQQSSPVGVNKPPRHPFARVATTSVSKTASKTAYDLNVGRSGSADVSILAVDQAYVDFQKCVLGTLIIDLF
eukprot:gene8818-33586_t